jgi:hypothetical protein
MLSAQRFQAASGRQQKRITSFSSAQKHVRPARAQRSAAGGDNCASIPVLNGGRHGMRTCVHVLTSVRMTAVIKAQAAAVATPSSVASVGLTDAPLPSLFPPEPKPPAPVSGKCHAMQ